MDEVLKEMADAAGIEFTGGSKEIPPPQVLADELGNLSLTWDEDRIQAQVNSIERTGRNLNCILSIRDYSKKQVKWISAPVRVNLLSDSAKSGLRRSLNERRGLDWATRIDQVVVAVHEAADNLRLVGVLERREAATARSWLLQPMAELNQHSMLVAAGGTGKSMLALALFASAATNTEIIPGIKPQPFEGNCLYLDWETDKETHEIRLTQICDGLGIPFPEGRIHYIRMAVPISEDVEYLHQYIIKNRIKFAVSDSVGMATAGDINSQADAIAYVNAVRALGNISFVSIHHVGWGNTDRSTGSRYFENAARSVWVLEKQQDAAAADSHLDLVHRKSNNGLLEASIGVRIEFGDAIRYYADTVSEGKRKPADLIEEVLSNGWIDLQAIYGELADMEKPTIRQTLGRMVTRGRALRRDGVTRINPEYALSVTDLPRHSDNTGGVGDRTSLEKRGSVSPTSTPGFKEEKEKSVTENLRLPYKDGGDDDKLDFG